MKYLQQKQHGIGLIEVLISTVVIAIGLLATASLQTGFLSGSSDNKARAEALVLAEQKIEELRNNATKVAYEAAPSSDVGTTTADPNAIVGTNATFTRSWTITDTEAFLTTAPARKNISVQVSWDSDGGTDSDGDGTIIDANEKVNITTEIAWINPSDSALYGEQQLTGAGGAVPSPRQNASEDIDAASEDVIGTNLEITDLNATTSGTAGVDQQLQVNPDGTILILSQVAPESHFYTAAHSDFSTKIDPGVIAVFLCNDADNDVETEDTCAHIQNHFGGVVHRVKGKVYSVSGNDLSDTRIAWTSSGVHACFNGEVTIDSGIAERAYECVYAGNCDASDEGLRTASSGGNPTAPGCFIGEGADSVVSDAQIGDRHVGPGGEYGDIGLLGLNDQGGGGSSREQVCFLEDTVDPETSPLLATSGSDILNENYLYSVTKRLYVTRRIERNDGLNINEHKSEGINRSYSNHNFFIVARGNGASANETCHDAVVGSFRSIAPRNIFRALNEGTDNKVTYEGYYDASVGTAHTLIGSVTSNNATKLRLLIPESGGCYLNNNLSGGNATEFACVVPADPSAVKIIGSSNEYKNADPSVFAECNPFPVTTPDPSDHVIHVCDWTTGFPDVFVDGEAEEGSCSTNWGATVANHSSVTAYSASSVPSGSACVSETQVCSGGTLSPNTNANATCTVANAAGSCQLPWSVLTIDDGGTVGGYTVASVASGQSCPSPTTLTCSSGSLTVDSVATGDTSYYQSCTVTAAYSILAAAANGSGSIATLACDGGSCVNLSTGTHNVAVTLSGGDTCTKDYTVNNSDISIIVTKHSSGTCVITP